MRILFLSLLLLCLGHKPADRFFPEKRSVLSSKFEDYDNFFPVATLDLSNQGIKDKIHIIYVAFDPDIQFQKPFRGTDNIDEITLKIQKDGRYKPMFDKSALVIGKNFERFFDEYKQQFYSAKEKNSSVKIRYAKRPNWLQNDETPNNTKGEPMQFICQIEMGQLIPDDCWLYVFYDKKDKLVKYIYQRT